MSEILVNDHGQITQQSLYYLLDNHKVDFKDALLNVLRQEANNPNSEFIKLLAKAMETIADSEIHKVLE